MNPYAGCKIRGPYLDIRDGRRMIHLIYPDGQVVGTTYARYLMEVHLERHLFEDENVHHINGDQTDDRLENFKVLKNVEHWKIHRPTSLPQDFECPMCGTIFTLTGKQINNIVVKRRYGNHKSGPYCSQSCRSRGFRNGITTQTPVERKYK
jgi:hypothetical protein